MDTSLPYDTPVVRVIGGERHEFPRLDLDDIEAIGKKLLAAKAEAVGRLSANLDAWGKFRALQELEYGGVPLGDVLRHGRTVEGMRAFCAASSRKASRPDDHHARLMRALGPIGQLSLATDLISLPAEPPKAEGEGPGAPRPLAGQTPSQSPA